MHRLKQIYIRGLIKDHKGHNVIRVETRLFKNQLVQSFLNVKTIGDLLKIHTPSFYEQSFISQIRRMILCDEPDLTGKLSFTSTLDLLTQFRAEFKTKAVNKFMLTLGLNGFLESVGSIEQFKALLHEAGYSKSDVSKYMAQVRETLELNRLIDAPLADPNSVSSLYKEFFDKALEVKYPRII